MPSGIPLKYFPFPFDRPDLETQRQVKILEHDGLWVPHLLVRDKINTPSRSMKAKTRLINTLGSEMGAKEK